MEPWEQQILAGLQSRHALYVDSVQDVMASYMHLSRLFHSQIDKNDSLKQAHSQLEQEIQSLREYRNMKEAAAETSDMERRLAKKLADTETQLREAQSQLSTIRDQLADANARAFDLRSSEERLQMLLEMEQKAHIKTRADLVDEIKSLRKICDELTVKQRDSSATIDTLQAQLATATEDLKKLVEEKFRLQSQLLTSSARNSGGGNNNAAAAGSPGAAGEAGGEAGAAAGGSAPASPSSTNNNNNNSASPGGVAGMEGAGDPAAAGAGGSGVGRIPTGPRFVLQEAHAADIQSVCFSEGGHRLFSGGYDKTIKIWDVAMGRVSHKQASSGTIMSLDSKGQYLVTGLSDNTCRLHIIAGAAGLRAKCQFTSHTDSVDAAYLSLDCERVFSTSRDCTIRSWNVARECLSQTTMCTSTACDIAVHSSVIASAHKDRSVRFWDTRTGRIAGECASLHDNIVTSVRFLNDARFTVSLARDNTARVCDVRTLREVERLTHEKLVVANNFMRLCTSPDCVYVGLPTADGSILVWEPRTNKTTLLKGGHSGLVNSVAWSDDGRTVASAGLDKKVVVWT